MFHKRNPMLWRMRNNKPTPSKRSEEENSKDKSSEEESQSGENDSESNEIQTKGEHAIPFRFRKSQNEHLKKILLLG